MIMASAISNIQPELYSSLAVLIPTVMGSTTKTMSVQKRQAWPNSTDAPILTATESQIILTNVQMLQAYLNSTDVLILTVTESQITLTNVQQLPDLPNSTDAQMLMATESQITWTTVQTKLDQLQTTVVLGQIETATAFLTKTTNVQMFQVL